MACLILRADAGGDQGSGHVMRVAALAQAWTAAGGTCVLASADLPAAIAARLAPIAGLRLAPMAAPAWSGADALALADLATREGAKAVVADSYLYGSDYLAALAGRGLIAAAIDDMGALGAYPCDLIVNQNLHADAALYHGKAGDAVLMLGPSFAILRPEFAAARGPRDLPLAARRVLVTFGGVDPKGASVKALDALRLLAGQAEAELIIGAANPRADEIKAAGAGLTHVEIVAGVTDMAARLARADIVLSAGGTTVWEAACMGAPMLLVAAAPEEAVSAGLLAKGGACRFLGPVEALDGKAIAEAIADFSGDLAARARASVLGQSLVDGLGAARVAEAINRLIAAA